MSDFLAIQANTGWGRSLKFFAEWCAPEPGWLCLDVGSGPGLLPALLQGLGCTAIGVDRDPGAFLPERLHPTLVVGQGEELPFRTGLFHLVTASNLLFLSDQPQSVLSEMARVTRAGSWVAVLNPSEHMSVPAAHTLADQYGLQGLARESLLNWADRAERHPRWNAGQLADLFRTAGLSMLRTELRMGLGLARLAAGRKV